MSSMNQIDMSGGAVGCTVSQPQTVACIDRLFYMSKQKTVRY